MSLFEIGLLVGYALLLAVLMIYSAHAYFMVYLYRRAKREGLEPECAPMEELPPVTVQLPIFNERYVVERLIDCVCAMDYPKDRLEVQVLDDSTDETVELVRGLVGKYRSEGIDIVHCRRSNREGYKAGALKAGLATAKGKFVAIFDADFTPPRDFLKRTIPHFADWTVGVVQARWGHLNAEYSLLTRGEAIGLDGHFMIEQTARNRHGLFINFNGTCGVWRKQCILDSGNWQADTLTEDMDLSYRAQLRGWKFVYVEDLVCPGEIPAEVNAFKVQQFRWAKGAVQTAKKLLPQIWQGDLPFLVKTQATIHLTNHLVFPVLMLISVFSLPLLYIKVHYPEARSYFLFASLFTLGAFSYPIFYIYSQKTIYRDWKKRLWALPFLMGGGIGISVSNSKAVLGGLFGHKKGTFDRTPKYALGKGHEGWKGTKYRVPFKAVTLFELGLAAYTFFGFLFALKHHELAALPFLMLYWLGYVYIGTLSLAHALKR